jgi:hypothetical protein
VAVSLVAQLLISAVMAASSPADAAPAKKCASPIDDPANHCLTRENGRVILQCTALADGTLKECVVLSETPAGKGFGDAALASVSTEHYAADPNRPAEGVKVKLAMNFKAGS